MSSRIIDHIDQPDNRTCQATAIAKVLGTQDVYGVRAALGQLGVAGDPAVMRQYLEPRVLQYKYSSAASLLDIQNWVTQGPGYECIIHGFTTDYGHVWGIENADPTNRVFVCDDPWFEFDFPAGRFTQRSGKNSLYSYRAIWAYCIASWSYSQSRDLYASGAVDQTQTGGWVHFIQN